MKPALTAEEWAEGEIEGRYGVVRTSLQVDHKGRIFVNDDYHCIILNEMDTDFGQKVAALCLHEQPFGFKPQEPAEEREIAGILEDLVDILPDGKGKRILALAWLCRKRADRIEALLPPVE